jgi:O-antigen ligase
MTLSTAVFSLLAIVLLLARPKLGVAALFIVRPLVDMAWDTPLVGSFKLTEIVSAAVPLAVLLRIMVDDSWNRPLAGMPLRGLWMAWGADVFLFSSIIMLTSGLVDGSDILLRHLNGLAGAYMVQAYYRDDNDARRFGWVLVMAGLIPMATGLIEGVTGHHWRVTYGEEGIIRNVGLYHDAITIRYYALQALLGILLVTGLQTKRSTFLNVLLAAYAMVALFVIKGAYSKSGVLIVLVWALLWPLILRKTKVLVAGAVLTIAAAAYYSRQIMESIGFIFVKELAALQGSGGAQRTFAGRWYIWDEIISSWQQLGVGSKIFGSGHIALGAHNDFLQVLFHGGIVGLGIYCTLLAAALWMVARIVLARRNVYAAAAALVLSMWMVDAVGLVPSAYTGYQWFIWGVFGLAVRLHGQTGPALLPAVQVEVVPRYANLMGPGWSRPGASATG